MVQDLHIFNILRKLFGTSTEKDIELILLMLKNIGFSLRRDDALLLKELISETQAKARWGASYGTRLGFSSCRSHCWL